MYGSLYPLTSPLKWITSITKLEWFSTLGKDLKRGYYGNLGLAPVSRGPHSLYGTFFLGPYPTVKGILK